MLSGPAEGSFPSTMLLLKSAPLSHVPIFLSSIVAASLSPSGRRASPQVASAACYLLTSIVAFRADSHSTLSEVGLVQRLVLLLNAEVEAEAEAAAVAAERYRAEMEDYKASMRQWGTAWAPRQWAPNPVKRPDVQRPKRPSRNSTGEWTLLTRAVAVVRNLCLTESLHESLLGAGVPVILSRLMRTGADPAARLSAAVALASLVGRDEDACRELHIDEFLVREILGVLQAAMMGRMAYGQYWTLWKLVVGLASLCVPDTNKVMVVEAGGVQLLADVLQGQHQQQTRVELWTCTALWNLAFLPEGRKAIINEPGCVPALRRILADRDCLESAREAAKGALWTIGLPEDLAMLGKRAPTKGGAASVQVPKTMEPHVLLSYEARQESNANLVRAELENLGYRVWMGTWVSDQQASSLEEMAAGVEAADVVVTLLSKKYKESQLCRTTAEYSFQCKKRIVPVYLESKYQPTGWLGALLGTKLYFNLSGWLEQGAPPNSRKFRAMARELGTGALVDATLAPVGSSSESGSLSDPEDRGIVEAEEEDLARFQYLWEEHEEHAVGPEVLSVDVQSSGGAVLDLWFLEDPDAATWTVDEVSTFLAMIALDDHVTPFREANVDGPALVGLWRVSGDKRLFNCITRERLGVASFPDRLRLLEGLAALFDRRLAPLVPLPQVSGTEDESAFNSDIDGDAATPLPFNSSPPSTSSPKSGAGTGVASSTGGGRRRRVGARWSRSVTAGLRGGLSDEVRPWGERGRCRALASADLAALSCFLSVDETGILIPSGMEPWRPDAIVVLAGGLVRLTSLPAGNPPWVRRRLDVGAALHHALSSEGAPGPSVICSGWGTPHRPPPLCPRGFPVPEAHVAAAYLTGEEGADRRDAFWPSEGHASAEDGLVALPRRLTVPPASVLREQASMDTLGNAFFTAVTHLVPRRWTSVAVVTSAFHGPRTRDAWAPVAMAAGLDVRCVFVSDASLECPDRLGDAALAPGALAERCEREEASRCRWRADAEAAGLWPTGAAWPGDASFVAPPAPGPDSLARLSAWLHGADEWVWGSEEKRGHLCYSVARQAELRAGAAVPVTLSTY